MRVEINGTSYEYLSKIVDNNEIRNNFIEFIYQSFGFHFDKWYNQGFWTSKYEPHVLVKDNQVVSTVTANYMKYLYGNEKNYIQIGGVLTREEYYKKGLAKWLMNRVVDEYKENCDQIFLFSDDVAVDFYPKMGFSKVTEYISNYEWRKKNVAWINEKLFPIKRLDIADTDDRKILLQCYQKSNPFSIFPSIDCEELVVFYGLEFYKKCFYYFPEQDIIAIANVKEEEIYLYDIYGNAGKNAMKEGNYILDKLIQAILLENDCLKDDINVLFGFSPKQELSGIQIQPLIQKDDTTFLLAGKENLFEHNKLRFPVLSHN